MRFKWIASILVIGLFLVAFYRPSLAQSSGFPVTVVDDDGNIVTIYQKPTRIVSLAPSNTILAYGLGLGNYLVGGLANEYVCATIAPQVKNLTSVGDYYSINYSSIIELQPQLILASGINSPQQIQKLRSMNFTVIVLNPTTISGVERDIMLLGNATGTQARAQEIVNWMNEVISEVRARVPSNGIKTFYLLDTTGGYWTGGNSTFIGSMIDIAGGTNIADNISGWGTISPEIILEQNPQVLILDQYVNASVVNTAPFNELAAVKDGRVYVIPHEGWFAQPTYRLVYGIVWLAEALYPNAMKGFTIPPCPAYTGSENVTQPVSVVSRSSGSSFPSTELLATAGIIAVVAIVIGVLSYRAKRHRSWL